MKLYKYKIILPNGKKLIQEASYFDTRTGDSNIYFFKKDHMVAVVPNGSAVIEIGYEE